MKDGAICMDRYSSANLRVMWILKQNIDFGILKILGASASKHSQSISFPTWRRISHASHSLISDIRDLIHEGG